jgi:hypothetical protein
MDWRHIAEMMAAGNDVYTEKAGTRHVSDIDTVSMGSLKALDPRRPIREADITRSTRSPRRRLLEMHRHVAERWTKTRFRTAQGYFRKATAADC